MAATRFGPGTLTFTIDAGTPADFAAEVKGGGVTHSYENVGDPITYLDGTAEPVGATRIDGLTFEVDNDLTAAGLYQFLLTNDLVLADFVYTPNTASGASWAGIVQLRLPDGVQGESYGAKLTGSVELAGSGPFTFTAATAA
jgi:hypothetical protein